ncbi:kelch-like protein 20 [Lethenteron reissneri]|uniref:kelch-like protein 20 n=1 Tax=Lethenteron reissneri TaxID=7753 RepID=UPI002AB775E8|nr:kelch-like protein 20 [Lethenteron reissneri]XP_061411302.1 kelch-like protein 20 [Lethenteron reissneri]
MFAAGSMRESRSGVVELRAVAAPTLALLLDFVYSGRVPAAEALRSEQAAALLVAADMMRVLSLKAQCERSLVASVSEENCAALLALAARFGCPELRAEATTQTLAAFGAVWPTVEFLQLPQDLVEELLGDLKLNVASEEEVLTAAVAWLKWPGAERPRCEDEEAAYGVLRHVKFPCLPGAALRAAENLAAEMGPKCRRLVEEAWSYRLSPARREELKSERSSPRPSTGRVEALLLMGSDASVCVMRPLLPSPSPSLPSLSSSSSSSASLSAVLSTATSSSSSASASSAAPLPSSAALSSTAVAFASSSSPAVAVESPVSPPPAAAVDHEFSFSTRMARLPRTTSSTSPSPPLSSSGCALLPTSNAAALGGFVFVLCRTGLEGAESLWKYEPCADGWIECRAPTPTAKTTTTKRRNSPALVAAGERLYLLGGGVRSVSSYDPRSNTWRAAGHLELAVASPAAVSLGGWIYLFGGESDGTGAAGGSRTAGGHGGTVAAVQRYDPRSETTELLRDMPVAELVLAVAFEGRVYLAARAGGCPPRRLLQYDPQQEGDGGGGGGFTELPSETPGRAAALTALVVHGARLFAFSARFYARCGRPRDAAWETARPIAGFTSVRDALTFPLACATTPAPARR